MSKLDELMARLCPDGVEFKTLGEIAEIKHCKDYKHLGDGKFPVYGSGGIMTYVDSFTYDKPTVLLPRKGSISNIFYVDKPFWNVDTIYYTEIDKEKIIPKFFYHFICNIHIERFNTSNAARPALTKEVLNKIKIPVLPLEIQSEIVRILDTFTELTEKLTAELAARKKQYEFYSTKLFLETNAEKIELSKLAEFVYGYTDKAKDTGNARFIRITDINEQGYLRQDEKKFITLNADSEKSLLKKGDITMARTGATYGKTLYFDDDFPAVYASFLIKIIPCEKLLSKYYWHFSKTPLYWEQANKLVTTGGQPQFNTPAVKQIKIPVPPIEEQERIVKILDRFDKLCNDLSEGLPAEISARKKQYEYYRDKLLTFKERETK